jgi:hypothetical protein
VHVQADHDAVRVPLSGLGDLRGRLSRTTSLTCTRRCEARVCRSGEWETAVQEGISIDSQNFALTETTLRRLHTPSGLRFAKKSCTSGLLHYLSAELSQSQIQIICFEQETHFHENEPHARSSRADFKEPLPLCIHTLHHPKRANHNLKILGLLG